MFRTTHFTTTNFDDLFEVAGFTSKSQVKKTDKGFSIDLLLPGFVKDEIDIDLETGSLTITAKTERTLPSFAQKNVKKSYDLEGIEVDSVEATIENGILHLDILTKTSPTRKISVK
jgi:HSP20 family protein